MPLPGDDGLVGGLADLGLPVTQPFSDGHTGVLCAEAGQARHLGRARPARPSAPAGRCGSCRALVHPVGPVARIRSTGSGLPMKACTLDRADLAVPLLCSAVPSPEPLAVNRPGPEAPPYQVLFFERRHTTSRHGRSLTECYEAAGLVLFVYPACRYVSSRLARA